MKPDRISRIVLIALTTLVIAFAETTAAAQKAQDVRSRLVAVKAGLMSADYRADLAELGTLRDQIEALRDDETLGYLADYWSGYASWRTAMNGASAKMSREDLIFHLKRAAAAFEMSIARKEDFADAYAAASSVHGWLLTFYFDDPTRRPVHAESAARFLKQAKELEPSNPRVLWVDAGNQLFRPAAYGGNFDGAMEIYRRIAASNEPLTPDSPFPDWGKVEAVMSLAYGHFTHTASDLAAASKEAGRALQMQPDWFYVRNVLSPQIEARRQPATTIEPCH